MHVGMCMSFSFQQACYPSLSLFLKFVVFFILHLMREWNAGKFTSFHLLENVTITSLLTPQAQYQNIVL